MAASLKVFFNQHVVESLAKEFSQAHGPFDSKTFAKECLLGLDSLELMARAWHIAEAFRRHLPQDFRQASKVILRTLPADPAFQRMDVFRYLPHVFYVSKYGIEHFEESMEVQRELTKHFTAEFSIRPFIEKYPEQSHDRLCRWAKDPNMHVRRLVSEGSRPPLPWAPRLRAYQKDPSPVLVLLELLKDDPELYVRRSVANSLNDIAKDHPEIAVRVCREWMKDATPERKWIINHALRSLVKAGNPGALAVMGVGAAPKIEVTAARFTPKVVKLGGKLQFAFDVASATKKTQTLQVDYRVHLVKANGKASPKVFKLRRLELKAGQSVTLSSTVSFAPMTTRKSYPGVHHFEALVNGVGFPLGSVRLQ
ncbi:MAG: DNA alkylation repair protein [Bryobacteraceae bacterium]